MEVQHALVCAQKDIMGYVHSKNIGSFHDNSGVNNYVCSRKFKSQSRKDVIVTLVSAGETLWIQFTGKTKA